MFALAIIMFITAGQSSGEYRLNPQVNFAVKRLSLNNNYNQLKAFEGQRFY